VDTAQGRVTIRRRPRRVAPFPFVAHAAALLRLPLFAQTVVTPARRFRRHSNNGRAPPVAPFDGQRSSRRTIASIAMTVPSRLALRRPHVISRRRGASRSPASGPVPHPPSPGRLPRECDRADSRDGVTAMPRMQSPALAHPARPWWRPKEGHPRFAVRDRTAANGRQPVTARLLMSQRRSPLSGPRSTRHR
jgi:hypothetical protein